MKIIVFLLLTTSIAYAQDGVSRVSVTRGSASYQQAYLNCSASEMRKLVADHASISPTKKVSDFFVKYPILDSMSKFKKKTKYSMINSALLADDSEFTDDNMIIFTFKNGKKYKIKIDDRIQTVYF